MRTVRRRRPGAAVLSLVTALALAVSLTACSGDSDDSSAGPADGATSGSDATEGPAPVATVATLGKLTGRLGKEKRSKTRKQVAKAVDAWFEAAYVGGDYPRNDFADSWPGFTVGAKADARSDKAMMSNQDIGNQVSAVEATARKVTVDLLAVKGHAVGATARVVLRFSTEGDVRRNLEVRGRLFLSRTADGWRIFGYDVTKGAQS